MSRGQYAFQELVLIHIFFQIDSIHRVRASVIVNTDWNKIQIDHEFQHFLVISKDENINGFPSIGLGSFCDMLSKRTAYSSALKFWQDHEANQLISVLLILLSYGEALQCIVHEMSPISHVLIQMIA